MLVKLHVSALHDFVNEETGGWLAALTVTLWELEFDAPRLSVTWSVTV